MTTFKQGVATQMLVRLEDSTGADLTGKAFNDGSLSFLVQKVLAGAVAKTLASSAEWVEVGKGFYKVALSTADTNTVGECSLIVTYGSISFGFEYTVSANITQDVYDRVGAPAGASIAADIAAVKVDTAAIKAKTDNLPASPAAVGSNMGSATSVTGDVGGKVLGGGVGVISAAGVRALDGSGNAIAPAATALSTAQWTNARAALLDDLDATISSRAPSSTAVSNVDLTPTRAAKLDNLDAAVTTRASATSLATTDGKVDAIKLKTDGLPADPADASDIAASFATVNGTLATIAGYVDTEVAAIKAKTDNLPALPASQGDVTTVGTAVAAVSTKLGTPAGASVSADIAAVASSSTSAASASAAALVAATNGLHAALGLFLVVRDFDYAPGTPDLRGVLVRLYDSQVNADADDGVTGLVVPEFTRAVTFNATALAGTAHRVDKVVGS